MKSSEQLKITIIPLPDIQASPFNPRKHFDEASIIELAHSILEKGVLQPILVRPIMGTNSRYEIIAGERRFRACEHLLLADPHSFMTIPAIIRDLDDEAALEIMIIENLQRKDIHPMEEAAGFFNLVRIKSMVAKEIAARVGKSPSYVAQRMKLNDLIEPIQERFYTGRIMVKDAMAMSALSAVDQKELYEEEIKDCQGEFQLGYWNLKKFQHALMRAPFDITDPTIKKDAGACTTCPHNSAFNSLLFPEMANNPICQNSQCFKQKCNLSFDRELLSAQEDPSVLIITGEYQPSKDTTAIMKRVDGVLCHGQYVPEYMPEYPDRSDFDNDNETEEEDEADFQKAVVGHKAELEKFQEKVSSGKFHRAFIIGGIDKGKYNYVKLNKSKGATGKVVPSDNGTPGEETAEIKFEIDRIKSREKRAKELDSIKLWAEVRPLFDPEEVCNKATPADLTPTELNAIGHALHNKLSYERKDSFTETFSTKYDKKSKLPDDYSSARLVDMLRFFMLDTLPPSAIYHEIEGDSAIMMKVAEEYYPEQLETICITQRDKATKRGASVEKRIKALQDKIKELKKAAKQTAPKQPSKGKGIKALIPQND